MNPREYLDSRLMHGIKLGLDNIRFLLEAAGNPHHRFPAVHIAGTNGKGSVAAMLHAVLCAAGYKVGRFTSPHLIDVNERFVINSVPIDNNTLDRHILFFQQAAAGMDHSPTYFEMTTAVAFRHFAEQAVDIAVIEVGLGGRFDSTNIILPEAAAITNIDFEHTQYLGDTLAKIAGEKAGILKKGVPAVVAEIRPEPKDVILARAQHIGCPVWLRDREFRFRAEPGPGSPVFSYSSLELELGPLPLSLRGTYQAENAATATCLCERLTQRFPRVTPEAIREGLSSARWPCRLERVIESPQVIVDATHTTAGARLLASDLPPCVVILAVSKDKPAASIVDAIAPIAKELVLSQFVGGRHLPIHELADAAGQRSFCMAESLEEAIAIGMAKASDSTPLLITGSIFAAGEARRILIEQYGAPALVF